MAFLVFVLLVAFVVVMVLRAIGSASSGPGQNPRSRRRNDDGYPLVIDPSSGDGDRVGGGWFSDLFGGGDGDGGDFGGGDSGGGGDGGGGE